MYELYVNVYNLLYLKKKIYYSYFIYTVYIYMGHFLI